MIKAYNKQPIEQIGEDDSDSSLDLASDEEEVFEDIKGPAEPAPIEIEEPSITT